MIYIFYIIYIIYIIYNNYIVYIHFYFLLCPIRKPKFPVEMELKCEEKVEEDEENDSKHRKAVKVDKAEEIFGRMLKMRQMMFDTASQNIHKSQERYKKDYDKKRNKAEVCIVRIVVII